MNISKLLKGRDCACGKSHIFKVSDLIFPILKKCTVQKSLKMRNGMQRI